MIRGSLVPAGRHEEDDLAPAKPRRFWRTEHVGWRYVLGALGAFLLLLAVGLLLGQARQWGAFRWITWATAAARGGGDHAGQAQSDSRSEVAKLKFRDGHAELGEFTVTVFQPVSRWVLRTDFKLEGKTNCPDKEAFQEFMGRNYRLFREQVTIAVRTASVQDLTDPQLRVLRKRIIARVNRALDQPFLSSVELTSFSAHESFAEDDYRPAPVSSSGGPSSVEPRHDPGPAARQ